MFKFLIRLFTGRKSPPQREVIRVELPKPRAPVAAPVAPVAPQPIRREVAAPEVRRRSPAASSAPVSVLVERRKRPRDIPVPDVSETNSDTAWAKFDA